MMMAIKSFKQWLFLAMILLAIGSGWVCIAQDALLEKQEDEAKIIYPKHKDIVIEQSDEDKKNTKERIVANYPLGKIPYYRYESIEGDYYRIKEPMPGRLKKADCYTSKEFKALDAQKIFMSNDYWMKFVVAAYYFRKEYDQEGVDLINTINPQFRNNTEIRILRARFNIQLGAFEAVILDVEPIINAKPGPGNSRPSNIRLIKATALMELHQYQDVLEELDKAIEESGVPVPEWIYLYARCHYKLGNYEKALANLDLNKSDFTIDQLWRLMWLKSRSLVLKDRPEYENALKLLEAEDMSKADILTAVSLDAAMIHATRPDVAKRNGKRALAIIKSLKKRQDYDIYVKDATMAETLAHLELGNYVEANRCMEALKAMYTTEEEFPYLKQLEKAIRLKQKFVPKGRMPLVREKYL